MQKYELHLQANGCITDVNNNCKNCFNCSIVLLIKFLPPDILRTKFDLPQSHLFRYFQVRDSIRHDIPSFPHQPPDSLMDTTLSAPVGRGVISLVAKLITLALSSPLTVKDTWEMELGVTFSSEWWQEAQDRINSTSPCASLILIQFKVLHRSHLTKVRLKKTVWHKWSVWWVPFFSPASRTQMFLSCPKLSSFWSVFYDTLYIFIDTLLSFFN